MEMIGSFIFDVIAMLVTLGILVTFHEYGHFWVARKCGVKVEKFSIGFGKPLLRWRGKKKVFESTSESLENTAVAEASEANEEGTEFVIAALPLGGYVKMLGEQDNEVPENQKQFAFNHKTLSQRTAIVAAGPAANFLLAIFLYWLMFMNGVSDFAPIVGNLESSSPAAIAGMEYGDEIIAVDNKETRTWQEVRRQLLDRLGESGELQMTLLKAESTQTQEITIPLQSWLLGATEPDVVSSLGMTPVFMDIPPRIGQLLDDGRALEAGFEEGDLVLSADEQAVITWEKWIGVIRENPEKDLNVSVDRRGQIIDLILRPGIRMDENNNPELDDQGRTQGYMGAGVELPVLAEDMIRDIQFSPVAALGEAVSETWGNSIFVLVAIKKMIIGLMSVNNISGPITIAKIAGDSASDGLEYFIGFLAILSISLGVMNLLPIPVLDGGHLFYYAIEAVTRKPLPEYVQEMGMRFGLLIIAGIMIIAFYNDINRLF
jgi:regulator of sigma E protease